MFYRFFICLLFLAFVVPMPFFAYEASASSLGEVIFPRWTEKQKKRERRKEIIERNQSAAKNRNYGYYDYQARAMQSLDFSILRDSFSPYFANDNSQENLLHNASLGIENLNDGLSSLVARETVGSAVLSYYKKNPKFLWLDENLEPTQEAKFIEQVFRDARSYGLENFDYEVQPLDIVATASDILIYEFSLTLRSLRYMLDARYGVVVPQNISTYHDLIPPKISVAKLMADLASSENAASLLLSMHPSSPAFLLLQRELRQLGDAETQEYAKGISHSTIIYPGQSHGSLSIIIDKLEDYASMDRRIEYRRLLSSVSDSTSHYSEQLVEFVRAVQGDNGLLVDGIIGPRLLLELFPLRDSFTRLDERRQKIINAMERLRWLPHNLGERYVMINSPAFNVSLVSGGEVDLSMRAVVGTLYNQTNFFTDEIEYVEFNPSWRVPRSIIFNEFLPESLANPSYLDDFGYEITIDSEPVRSSDIDWHSVTRETKIVIRQPPGKNNALGTLKIMFPNPHAIYMHDTPERKLFNRRERAFSHGCIRLERPYEMAAALLERDMGFIEGHISSGETHQVLLPERLAVYVSYFTAWPNKQGEIEYFADIYNRDRALSKALVLERYARLR